MIKVLFIHSSAEMYGSDRSLLNIVKYLDKSKYEIHVLLPCNGPLVDNLINIEKCKVELYDMAVLRRKDLSIKGLFHYLKKFKASYNYFKKYIKENNIDIVDTNTSVVFPGAMVAKRLKKISVWHSREIIKNKFENRVISYFMNKYSDYIVANSMSTGKALKVEQSKIRVIYNGVEEKVVPKQMRSQLTVGMAGRINRWKGQKVFVDMAEIVHRSIPEVVFEIAGEAFKGEEYLKEELVYYIKSKGLSNNVILLGQIDSMAEFYAGLDVFVLPSIQPEPFGLVLIEAMDSGLPVVATNQGGPTEIIDDGIDGYLVDFRNTEQMANRVCELLHDEEKRCLMGQKGKEKKRKYFSVNAMAERIDNLFTDIMKK